MRSGTWDSSKVSDDNVRVYVNGVARPVDDVRIRSGMRDGHPLSDTTSWCVEADIDWADPETVSAGAPEVFTGGSWVPMPGDKVEIFTGDGATDTWWRRHVGWIEDTTGSFADGTARSSTVDDVEELDRPIHYYAIPARTTPIEDGEPFRHQGIQGIWFVDQVLRGRFGERGWYATPPVTWQTIASVTGLGSLRPEVGRLLRSDGTPTWRVGDDGHPYPSTYSSVTRFDSEATTSRFVVTFAIPAPSTGSSGTMTFRDGAGAGPSIRMGANLDIGLGHHGESRQYFASNGARRAAVLYERISSTEQRMTLRFDDGREFTHNTTTGTLPSGWAATEIDVTSGVAFSWWMLEDDKPAGQEWASLEYVPTARIRVDAFHRWDASRDQPQASSNETVRKQLEAECATAWLDEDGGFQWAGRGVLEAQAPAQTVSSGLDLDELQWGVHRRAGARSVAIRYQDVLQDVDSVGAYTRTLWSSSGIDLAPGEVEVTSVSVPADEDWVVLDLNPHHVYEWGNAYTYYTRGSTFGGTQYVADTSDQAAWCQFIACTMTKVGLRDFEVSFSPWSSIAATSRVNSNWPDTTSGAKRGESPLNLRGRLRLVWRDREKVKSTGNTKAGPRFVHDVGWRVQDVGNDLTDLLDWMATELGDPKPVVSLTLAHDPRRQIGDKVRVEDRDVTGTWVEMLVQECDFNARPFTDSIRGRVTAYGALADVSLHAPSGHTALTPATDWNRDGEVA